MEESQKGRVNIKSGGNTAYAEGKDSIAVGGNFFGDLNKQTIQYGIELDQTYLATIHKEYADSLKQFVQQINKQIQAEKIPADKFTPVQDNLNAVAKELEGVKPDEDMPTSKEYSIGGKFSAAIEGLLDISPQVAETVVSSIPILSIFSKPIGRGVESIIQKYRNRKK